MKNNAVVTGIAKIVTEPTPSHYHNGVMYHKVQVEMERPGTQKIDVLRLYFNEMDRGPSDFALGSYITFTGDLVKSKITEALADIAVALRQWKTHLAAPEKTYADLELTGMLIKINEESTNNNVTSVSILVQHTNHEDNRRVIVKLTGIGKAVPIIKSLAVGDTVDILAHVYSYKVKNRELTDCYLHDSRIVNIKKL